MKRLVSVLPGLLVSFLLSALICTTIRALRPVPPTTDPAWNPYWTAVLIFQTGVLLMLYGRLGRAWSRAQVAAMDRCLAKNDIPRAEICAARLHRGLVWMYLFFAQASALDEVGLRCRALQNWTLAEQVFRLSLERTDSRDPVLHRAACQVNLALTLTDLRQFVEAEALYHEALRVAESRGKKLVTTQLIENNLGHLYVQTGRLDEADQSAKKLLDWGVAGKDVLLLSRGECLLCHIERKRGNIEVAREHARRALGLLGKQSPAGAKELRRLLAEMEPANVPA